MGVGSRGSLPPLPPGESSPFRIGLGIDRRRRGGGVPLKYHSLLDGRGKENCIINLPTLAPRVLSSLFVEQSFVGRLGEFVHRSFESPDAVRKLPSHKYLAILILARYGSLKVLSLTARYALQPGSSLRIHRIARVWTERKLSI